MTKDTEYAYTHGLISKAQKVAFDEEYTGKKLANLDWAIHKLCGVYMTNIAKTGDPSFQPIYDYFNRSDVRTANHISADMPKITQNWSRVVSKNYKPLIDNSYADVVQNLLVAGFTFQIISGLNDAKDCNFVATSWCG